MLSNKPYLLRAFYEWIVDSHCTPFIVINATFPRTKVPEEFIENGEITLNVSPDAIRDFKISNETVEFRASFSGVVHIISAPVKAVLAIYAQENQQGMFFDYEDDVVDGDDEADWNEAPVVPQSIETLSSMSEAKRPSHLKLVE